MSIASDAADATASEPVSSDVVTVAASEWDDPDAEQPRDWLGRPLIELPDAKSEADRAPYRRISTVAGTLTEQTALRTFLMRQLAVGLVKAPDLQGVIAGLDLDNKADRKTLDELIEVAGDRSGGKAKALWGTAVHRFTEPGAPMDWTPPAMRADVESYWRETEARGIRRELSETFVVNDVWRCSGTFDGAFYVPGWSDGPDGGLLLGDVKTGALHPGQHALQLAAYASGVLYDFRKGFGQKRTALPRIRQDVGLLLHVPKGEGDTVLYLIDLQAGREALELASQVFAWRARKDLAQLFDAVSVPATVEPYDLGGELPQAYYELQEAGRVDSWAVVPGPGPERVTLAGTNDDAPMTAKVRSAIDVRHDAEAARATRFADVPAVVEPVLDVNGNPVELKGDGFDDLRVSDPVAPAHDPEHLVADHLGGRALSLAEQVASASTEPMLNRLWETNREHWTPELTRLVQARLAVLQPGRA